MRPIIYCILIFVLAACALEPASSIGEIELTVIVNTALPDLPTFTPQPQASATLVISASSTPNTGGQAVVVNTNCNPRTDLVTYTVVTGDSLSSIAARTNSRVSQLVEWNCLADANMIVVGMQLKVAREASAATMTHTPTPLPTKTVAAPVILGPMGALAADPAVQDAPNWSEYLVEPQHALTIIWSGIDPEYYVEVGQIEFFYTPDNGTAMSIGIDSDKSDGMSITWTTPANVLGRITARATYGMNGSISSPAIQLRPR